MKKIVFALLFFMTVVGSVIVARPLLDDTPDNGMLPVTVIKILNPRPPAQQVQSLSFHSNTTHRAVSAHAHLSQEGLWVRLDEPLQIRAVTVRNLTTGESGAAMIGGSVQDMLLSFPLTTGHWRIFLKCEGFEHYSTEFIYDESNPWFIMPVPAYRFF